MTTVKVNVQDLDFQSGLKPFDLLRKENDFLDVTLISDDQKKFEAHKVVLSACSLFFKEILKSNNHPNPLLYLGGVGAEDLKNVLDYIYLGEVNILQEKLENFMAIAKKFILEGLEDARQPLPVTNNQDVDTSESAKKTHKNVKKPVPEPLIEIEKRIKMAILSTKKIPSRALYKNQEDMNKTHVYKFTNEKIANLAGSPNFEIEKKIVEQMDRNNGINTCKVCGYIGRAPGALREHVETHFEGLRFPCNQCDKVYKSSAVMKGHMRNHKYKFA